MMNGSGSDLRFAWRQIRRQPGFSVLAILVLALGIGASAAVFSVLYENVLKPLPYPQPERLVSIHNAFPKGQTAVTGVSGFDYAEIKGRTDTFESAAIYYFNDLTLTGAGMARHVDAVNVSASLFKVLGVKPQLGRLISADDDRRGAPGTALLSDAFWRTAFGGDPAAIGRTVHLAGRPYRIIGVMPRGFAFPYPATQLWIPIALKQGEFTIEGGRLEKWLHMIARTTPGISPQRAETVLQAIGHGIGMRFPQFYPETAGWHFMSRPLADEQTDEVRRWLFLAFAAVLCVFLAACSNVGGLMLIRTTARNGELAVRTALGASTARLVRLILTETALVALAGCGLGLLLAVWAIDLSNRYGPITNSARIGIWTLLFAFGIAAASVVVAGLVPALGVRVPIDQALKSGVTRTSTQSGALRAVLVAAQVAVALTLVFIAVLLTQSFLRLMQVAPGFAENHVWTGALEAPMNSSGRYEGNPGWNARFVLPLLDRLASLPEIVSVSACNAPPFNPSGMWTEALHITGLEHSTPPPQAQLNGVLPGYFETMKIPLLRGRTFTPSDRAGSQTVAVIDDELARRYFPNQDPIGKHIGVGGMTDKPSQVVGVVGSVANTQLGGPHNPELYFSELQDPSEQIYLVIRTRNDADITPAVRGVLSEMDPNVPLFDVATMEERISASVKVRRFIALVLNAFAASGLLLAALGVYASLRYAVELRRREIAIRMALGAKPSDVVSLVTTRNGIAVGAGFAAGLLGVASAERLVRSQLFGVRALDVGTWTIVLAIVGLAVMLAALFPVRRAARTDPVLMLRDE